MLQLVVRFSLLHGRVEAFDALARETLAHVREAEPGTLVYACHHVEGDPNARVFYELYRDRDAFEQHEQQAHVLNERGQHLAAEPRVEFLELQEARGIPGG